MRRTVARTHNDHDLLEESLLINVRGKLGQRSGRVGRKDGFCGRGNHDGGGCGGEEVNVRFKLVQKEKRKSEMGGREREIWRTEGEQPAEQSGRPRAFYPENHRVQVS